METIWKPDGMHKRTNFEAKEGRKWDIAQRKHTVEQTNQPA